MTKAEALDWLEAHPEARPRRVSNGLQTEWRVFGQHHITYWGSTLVKAIQMAEKHTPRNRKERLSRRKAHQVSHWHSSIARQKACFAGKCPWPA